LMFGTVVCEHRTAACLLGRLSVFVDESFESGRSHDIEAGGSGLALR
jgi:hypothetical protein